MSRRGAFVGFVGLDGSGKTTQARRAVAWLVGHGVDARFLPNRSLLDVRVMLDAVAARRGWTNHFQMWGPETARVIAALIKRNDLSGLPRMLADPGTVVVADRAVTCQLAALHACGAHNEVLVRNVFSDLPRPDVHVMLHVDPRVAYRRVLGRGSGTEDYQYLVDLQEGYRQLPDYSSFHVIDGDGGADDVEARVRDTLAPLLRRRGLPV